MNVNYAKFQKKSGSIAISREGNWSTSNSRSSVEFKFVARQVAASVVIRSGKLKFVAASRTNVYFAQHASSTGNSILLRDKLVTNVVIRATICFNLQ